MIHWLRALALETQRGANNRQPASDSARSMNKTFVEINPEMGPDEMVTDAENREFWDRTSCFFRWEMANMKAAASSPENECVCVCVVCLTSTYRHVLAVHPFSVLCLRSYEFSPPGGPGVPG